MKSSNPYIEVRKHKGEIEDTYACRECGRVWKSSAKKIGHKKSSCNAYHKKVYGWV